MIPGKYTAERGINMNTIIIFSSKYGCTADCASNMKEKLTGSVTLVDINKTNTKIELDIYDTIIIGSSIYVGAISKKLRALCTEYVDLLSKKRIGIFLCCAFSEQVDEYLSSNFPPTLLKNVTTVKMLGGEARLEKMSFLDKLIVKSATNGNYKNLKISNEKLEDFVREISLK